MSEIRREFEQHLAGWRRRYAGHPEREIVRLSLLALEREENVSVAYSARVLGRRLAAIPVPADVRDVMREALSGVWQDEEWHTTYVRRALQRRAAPLVAVRSVLHQTAGATGGWTVAERQHRPWTEAPLSRAAATLLLWVGWLTRQVPRSVRPHVDYCSFKEFCRYNVDTETTAWLCWQRLAELAAEVGTVPEEQVREFRRIADDEDRHRRVFAVLAHALADGDRLRDDVTRETLVARLRNAAPERGFSGTA
jgi:hypothetical protein